MLTNSLPSNFLARALTAALVFFIFTSALCLAEVQVHYILLCIYTASLRFKYSLGYSRTPSISALLWVSHVPRVSLHCLVEVQVHYLFCGIGYFKYPEYLNFCLAEAQVHYIFLVFQVPRVSQVPGIKFVFYTRSAATMSSPSPSATSKTSAKNSGNGTTARMASAKQTIAKPRKSLEPYLTA